LSDNLYNQEKESYLQIVDFRSTIKNKGYATATFEVFEKLAKQMGYARISVHTPLSSGEIETYLNYLRTF